MLSTDQGTTLPFIINSIKELMQSGGVSLREWVSNNPSLLSLLDEKERVKSSEVKILGYLYDSALDSLQLKVTKLNEMLPLKDRFCQPSLQSLTLMGYFPPYCFKASL